MELPETKAEAAKETGRVEAFSDGVFAIAITLLILEIHVPEFKAGETLWHSLEHEWASLLAFLIGFFTILICWINHHYMFQWIHRTNSTLLLVNGFKLLVVSTTPFVTAVLAKNIQSDWAMQAVNLYCLNFVFMGTAMAGIWCYAHAKGFVKAHSESALNATRRLYIFAGIISTSIWIVSFFSITACLILSGLMFCIFISPKQAVAWQVNRDKE